MMIMYATEWNKMVNQITRMHGCIWDGGGMHACICASQWTLPNAYAILARDSVFHHQTETMRM
jgi:hypothetical protein